MTEVIKGEMDPFLAHRLRSASFLNKNEKILQVMSLVEGSCLLLSWYLGLLL